MNLRRSAPIVSTTALALALAACSGNMGSGATPPLSAPVAGAPLTAQNAATAPLPGSSSASDRAPLSAELTFAVLTTSAVALPNAGGFSGSVCMGPATARSFACAVTDASPSPAPSASATPTGAPRATSSPESVLITPPPKKSIASGVTFALHTYPTAAPPRDDDADDGATHALATLDITPSIDVTMNGLDAFRLTLPKELASSEHHYALVLFDGDPKPSHGGGVFAPHHKTALHGSAMALTVRLTGTTLEFVDSSTPITLSATHRYIVVVYSDTVTPTTAPSGSPVTTSPVPNASSSPSASARPNATSSPDALQSPYITYPTSSSVPLSTATPPGVTSR